MRFPNSGTSEPKCGGTTVVGPAVALRIGKMYSKPRGDAGYMALCEALEIRRMRSLAISRCRLFCTGLHGTNSNSALSFQFRACIMEMVCGKSMTDDSEMSSSQKTEVSALSSSQVGPN